jgi:hypothetical protein
VLLFFITFTDVYETQFGNRLIPSSDIYIADPSGLAVSGAGLRPLDCWDRGFDSHRGCGYSSVVLVACCADSDLCDRLITHCEDSYRLCVSDCVGSSNHNNDPDYTLLRDVISLTLWPRATHKLVVPHS